MKKICIPFIAKNKDDVLSFYDEVKKVNPDLIEIWFDNLNPEDFEEIISKKPCPILGVCKWQEERWNFLWSEEERVERLINLCKYWADFVDIWFTTDIKLIEKLFSNKWNTKIILSYHNWAKTPKLTIMLWVINKMIELKPDFIKYITTAKSEFDNVQIYRLCENLEKKKIDFIVMTMWEKWKQSRIICPILGSSWTYCPIDIKKSTAPGQIGFEEMREVFGLI